MINKNIELIDRDIVNSDKDTIYLGNIFTVDSDLFLPKTGKLGSTISWVSKNQAVINNEGKVIRPEAGQGNIIVTLIATVTKGQALARREYEVTVIEKEKLSKIASIKETLAETIVNIEPELPTIVVTVLDDGSYSTANVMWDSIPASKYSIQGTIQVEGTVTETHIKALARIKIVPENEFNYKRFGNYIHSIKAEPFKLKQVILADNIFIANRNRTYEYLLSINEDQMLYNFRDAAGLATKGAAPMTGWDSPDCNLKGHTTGHYLSALAQAYASSGDNKFKVKLDYMVSELSKCQEAIKKSEMFSPGFLSGYSEEQFGKLEDLTPYPKIWAPYYTLHKIMAGLLDSYTLASNKMALEICTKLGDWVYTRLSRLSKDKLNSMWALYIAGEFGGMNEVMAKLYGLTNKEDYLKAAKYFNNDKLYVPMANGFDTLCGMHANQHIPQIIGSLEIFSQTKEYYYYNASNNFWNMVTAGHIYNIGGTGSGEMFKEENKIARYITDKTSETCASYNMLKLTKGLFCYNAEAKYMDYYERTLYNHILASQDQSGPTGGSTYFMPLCPGMQKDFDLEENSCCHGTGMENHTKYQDSIYFKSTDRSTLYINLYIASILNWNDTGFSIIQSGNYLTDQAMSIIINGTGYLDLKLRVPYWIKKGFTIKINEQTLNLTPIPGSYISLCREWSYGDKIDVSVPFTFRLERTPDDFNTASIMYGPLVMVAKSNLDKFIELNLNNEDISKLIHPTDNSLTFTLNDHILVPIFAAYNFPYHAYFKIK